MNSDTRAAIQRICKDLGLPSGDAYTQDWIYELPEAYRRPGDLPTYKAAYERPDYGDDEKRLLMQLMLDMVNDLLQEGDIQGRNAWEWLKDLLSAKPELHRDQIQYWSLPESALEDAFALTPWMRSFAEHTCKAGHLSPS